MARVRNRIGRFAFVSTPDISSSQQRFPLIEGLVRVRSGTCSNSKGLIDGLTGGLDLEGWKYGVVMAV